MVWDRTGWWVLKIVRWVWKVGLGSMMCGDYLCMRWGGVVGIDNGEVGGVGVVVIGGNAVVTRWCMRGSV